MCENVEMRNITVTVDDHVHRFARMKAAERGTSISAAVREFLIRWAGEETEFDRRKRLQDETLRNIDTFPRGRPAAARGGSPPWAAFVDTNVLLYGVSTDHGRKRTNT